LNYEFLGLLVPARKFEAHSEEDGDRSRPISLILDITWPARKAVKEDKYTCSYLHIFVQAREAERQETLRSSKGLGIEVIFSSVQTGEKSIVIGEVDPFGATIAAGLIACW
jgi:hypothetical protein